MDTPLYVNPFFMLEPTIRPLLNGVPWLQETTARKEAFMSDPPGQSYTYGKGRGERTYTSVAYLDIVRAVLNSVNRYLGSEWGPECGRFSGCFLNRYDSAGSALGWHSDDFPRMDQSHPIAVVSFGEPREIWWRKLGPDGKWPSGIVPPECRQLLAHGSLFVMPGGFQQTHQHRIPRGDREMGPRVSLTFRRFV